MRSARATTTTAVISALTVILAACGGEVLVTTERADPISVAVPPVVAAPEPDDPSEPADPGAADPDSADPGTGPPGAGDPDEPGPGTSGQAGRAPLDPSAIDLGPNKPGQPYDDFLLAVVTDLELWWSEQYPAIYGDTFVPLEGGVYAAYADRPDDIPGCGTPRTTYEEVQEFVAFYCGVGDFIVYDDGGDGLLADLAREYGAGTIGTVLAHEYGHAIQLRNGGLDRALPTVVTEQQADCFAGAWTGRAARGEAATVRYGDGDVRAGLIAMTEVSDPVGLDQFVAGGHGSAFDRVGAFQVGFNDGPARCAELLDDPLPLMPNQFTPLDAATGGDARFGYGDDDLLGFIRDDLNRYWDQELSIPGLDPLRLRVARSADGVECDDLRGDFGAGAALCADTGEVWFNEPVGRQLYDEFGDFTVGYLLGSAWSEAVQDAVGTGASGEERALLNDCLTGAWVNTVVPIDFQLPQPRLDTRTVRVSPGDLDEAIQTLLIVADIGSDDDVLGDAFEKIDAFRTGVLGGLAVCDLDL